MPPKKEIRRDTPFGKMQSEESSFKLPISMTDLFVKRAKSEGIRRIAHAAGIKSAEVKLEELAYLASRLGEEHGLSQEIDAKRGPKYGQSLLKKYFGSEVLQTGYTSAKQKLWGGALTQQFMQSAELVFDAPTDGYSYLTYGTFYPTYAALLQSQPDTQKLHRSVLVGAMTADTIREYETFMRSRYRSVLPLSVDLIEGVKRESKKFAVANGLFLPFPSKSMDTVQTNTLLHLFMANSSCNKPGSLEEFLVECRRVLKPTGKLLLLETHLESYFPMAKAVAGMNSRAELLKSQLKFNGFPVVTEVPVRLYLSRSAILATELYPSKSNEPTKVDKAGVALVCEPRS